MYGTLYISKLINKICPWTL